MAFSDKPKKTYYSIDKDKAEFLEYRGKDTEPGKGTRLEGTITKIDTAEYEYKGTPSKKLNVHMTQEHGEQIVVQLGLYANYMKGALNSLCSADLTKPVSFSIGFNNEFLNIWVNQGQDKLDWKHTIPKKADGEELVKKWVDDRLEDLNTALFNIPDAQSSGEGGGLTPPPSDEEIDKVIDESLPF